jgi:5-oxoprolinase (ATP-hydrolysing)
MEYAVRYQHEQYSGKLKPGDHILTNHPLAGGTHLPDITIVTPVWDRDGTRIIFYVASRGHHGMPLPAAPSPIPPAC